MKCDDVRDLLDEYVDGELAPADRASVEEHLAGCEACRTECEELRKTAELVRSMPRAAAPEGLVAEVRRQIEERRQARRWVIVRWSRAAGWAAAAAIVAVIIRYAPWEREVEGPSAPVEQSARALRAEVDKEAERAADAMRLAKAAPELGLRREDGRGVPSAPAAPAPTPPTASVPEPRATATLPGDRAKRLERDEAFAGAPSVASARGGGPQKAMADAAAKGGANELAESARSGPDKLKEQGQFRAAAKPEPAELVYECASVEAGRGAVAKALAEIGGSVVAGKEQAAKDAKPADNVVTVAVPRAKVGELIAALKLTPAAPEPSNTGKMPVPPAPVVPRVAEQEGQQPGAERKQLEQPAEPAQPSASAADAAERTEHQAGAAQDRAGQAADQPQRQGQQREQQGTGKAEADHGATRAPVEARPSEESTVTIRIVLKPRPADADKR